MMNWQDASGSSTDPHVSRVATEDFVMRMGMQYGQRLWTDSERSVSRWLPVAELKKRFRVSHKYVLGKLAMIAFPFRRSFERRQLDFGEFHERPAAVEFYPPVDDVCAPDLYIPLMGVITYITLYAFAVGLRTDVQELNPQDLAATATLCAVSLFAEIFAVNAWRYVVGLVMISHLDLLSVFGYAFVSVSLLVLLGSCGLMYIGWLFYTLVALTTANFIVFLYKYLTEFFAKDGVVPGRALPILYACCAAQVPLFLLTVARPFY